MSKLNDRMDRRRGRVRAALQRASHGRKRLSVFRSSKHIYAQVIDDVQAVTVASASTNEKEVKGKGHNVAAASDVGMKIAERAKAAGVERVVFDRGAYMYHGRVKALADAAREAGLNF